MFYDFRIPPNMIGRNVAPDWHRAFHGTPFEKVKSILTVGKIVPTGKTVWRLRVYLTQIDVLKFQLYILCYILCLEYYAEVWGVSE